jgi:hypothetical protein
MVNQWRYTTYPAFLSVSGLLRMRPRTRRTGPRLLGRISWQHRKPSPNVLSSLSRASCNRLTGSGMETLPMVAAPARDGLRGRPARCARPQGFCAATARRVLGEEPRAVGVVWTGTPPTGPAPAHVARSRMPRGRSPEPAAPAKTRPAAGAALLLRAPAQWPVPGPASEAREKIIAPPRPLPHARWSGSQPSKT